MTGTNTIQWGRSVWGTDPGDYPRFFKQLADQHYKLVEVSVPDTPERARQLHKLAREHDLAIIAQQGTQGHTPEQHIASFERQLDIAAQLAPVLVNSHTGKDWFSLDDNIRIIIAAHDAAAAKNLPLVHETHRGRALFSLPRSRELIDAIPDLRLCLDLSHWCCVHESLLEDQKESLKQAMHRADYAHLRVGHGQGSQIPALDTPLWQKEIDAHLTYWISWMEIRQTENKPVLCSPEFGPPPYLALDPDKKLPPRSMELLNTGIRKLVEKRLA